MRFREFIYSLTQRLSRAGISPIMTSEIPELFHGELDLATVETLRAALDDITDPGRLVLDLRGLSFLDSTGLHLLVALHQRAQRDGFQLALLAPAAPANKPIRLLGLDQALPFAAPDDALDRQPGESASGPSPGGRGLT